MTTQNRTLTLIRDLQTAAQGAETNGQHIWALLFKEAAEVTADLHRKSGAQWDEATREEPLCSHLQFLQDQGSVTPPAIGVMPGDQLGGGMPGPGATGLAQPALHGTPGHPARTYVIRCVDGMDLTVRGWLDPLCMAVTDKPPASGHGFTVDRTGELLSRIAAALAGDDRGKLERILAAIRGTPIEGTQNVAFEDCYFSDRKVGMVLHQQPGPALRPLDGENWEQDGLEQRLGRTTTRTATVAILEVRPDVYRGVWNALTVAGELSRLTAGGPIDMDGLLIRAMPGRG